MVWIVSVYILIAVLAVTLVLTVQSKSSYYRGIYEGCVRQSEVAGKVTLFDLISCREIADHAREERWFENVIDY